MKLILLFTISLFCSSVIAAETTKPEQKSKQGFLYGIGVALNQEIYLGYNHRIIPLPIIGYNGEKLKVLGPFVSYKIANIKDINISLVLAPTFKGFKASDSEVFIGMDKRSSSVAAGLALRYKWERWKVGITNTHDILNKSNGHLITAKLAHVFNQGPIFIEPSIAITYQNRSYVDYYYGVKKSEALESRIAYTGKNALNTSLGLSISTPIFFDGFTRLTTQYTHYDSTITNSPLVDKNSSFSVTLLFSRFF